MLTLVLFTIILSVSGHKSVTEEFYPEWRRPEPNEVRFEQYLIHIVPAIQQYIVSDRLYNITQVLEQETRGTALHEWKVKFVLESTDYDKQFPFILPKLIPLKTKDRKLCRGIFVLNPWNATVVVESFNCETINDSTN